MATSSTTRRGNSTRQLTRPKKTTTSPDQLADQLATGLTISNAKGKQKALAVALDEDVRLSAMRSVNSASQALTAAVQLGWKRSSLTSQSKLSTNLSNITSSAASAAKNISLLRSIRSNDIDIERAAASVLTKLVALEMFEDAMKALEELHLQICSLLDVTPKPRSHLKLHLLSIPIPSSDSSPDTILLTLVSTYLTYALTIFTHVVFVPALNTKDNHQSLEAFSQALTTAPSLISWIPSFSSLPVKQLDSTLTRAYASLTKACTSCKLQPKAIFQLRMYAVACLGHTSTGTVEPDTFWDQVCRFGGAFIKARDGTEEQAMSVVLSAYCKLMDGVEKRKDEDVFMAGKGFVGFCEYWMAFAKKAGDICVLDRISNLMRNSSAASSLSPGAETVGDIGHNQVHNGEKQQASRNKDTTSLEGARICATLSQITVVLEQKGSDLIKRAHEVIALFKRRSYLVEILVIPDDADEQSRRARGKVDRALEKMRRAAIAMLDSSTTRPLDEREECVHALLEELVNTYDISLRQKPNDDLLTQCLDTLFFLSRTALNPADPRTYVPAHDYLTRATSLLGIPVSGTANYTRCVSGAFHNLGATMYQAGRHGTAIGFLKDACSLGVKALDMWKKKPRLEEKAEDRKEKMNEAWHQLEEQLYRRWELLGVCYSKIGDRKQAFETFVECIKTFPYAKSGFIARTKDTNLQGLFDTSNATKQLATMVDRVTYLGVCELLLDTSLISLRTIVADDLCIIGALLERQIDSLESSRWKEGVQTAVAQMLIDVLGVYGPDMPVRRARVLLKCMEFAYHVGPEAVGKIGTPEEVGSEIERLLSSQNIGQDTGLVLFCKQYQASAHLWLALHAHRRADADQTALVAYHSEQACNILNAEPKSARKSSPRQVVATNKTASGPPAKQRPVRKAVPPREPVTPKPKTRKALQPMSLNVVTTPPRQNEVMKPLLVVDELEKLISLLQLTARISGLLALILPKIHILDVVRKLCERQLGTQSDGYILASIDLAHEYVKLSKTKRAASIFNQGLNTVKAGQASDEASVLFFLRFAESLAIAEDVGRSSSVYCEALALSDRLDFEDKELPSTQRIHTRAKRLERAAMASHVFALIQYSKDEVTNAFDGLLQALRLWNRATDTLMRLNPPSTPPLESTYDANPFQMTSLKDALPVVKPGTPPKVQPASKKPFSRRASMDGLAWRISEGLLVTLFSLSQTYLNRGSAREAEYFAQQAQDLAESLNAPTMISRALVKKGEIQLYQGQLEASHESLMKASQLLKNMPGIDNADARWLRGVYNERTAQPVDASDLYEETITMIEELDQALRNFDGLAFGRKSVGTSPSTTKHTKEVVLPELLAVVLRQRIWLLRDNGVEDYTIFLDRFLSLPNSSRTKAEENALMAKLTLHAAYGRFRADMFLNSLAESTIALPMGMSTKNELTLSPQTQDILVTLDSAEALFWANLALIARRGSVPAVRDTVMSLALIRAFQTSLGKSGPSGPTLAVGLLDTAAAITLRREMLEAVQHKFGYQPTDDLHWPLMNSDGTSLPHPPLKSSRHLSFDNSPDSNEDENAMNDGSLAEYWSAIRTRYQSRILDPSSLSGSQMIDLPCNWSIVHINVTEDKSTLFIARQDGEEHRSPLIFCVPLKGRRDNGSGQDEEEHLTYEDALDEFNDIVRLSDEGTKSAIQIKADDQEARTAWWKTRVELDTRMRELLENIEFCWLGAFKTILSPRPNLTPDMICDLRLQFERIFMRNLHVQDKKTKQRSSTHRKTASKGQSQFPSQVMFDDAILECFSTLSPKCRDEELEDLVYFVLDLYQFHGVPVAIAEVDIVQVVVDLRVLLEDHAMKLPRRKIQRGEQSASSLGDEHIFLILDKNLQGLPWESIPILRGRSVSRIPSIDFLHDRILFAGCKRDSRTQPETRPRGAAIDPRRGYYILNPSGDLGRTESRFKSWATEMEQVGWQGVTGRAPSEQEFLTALQNQDLVIYFGHGGGEQYMRSHKIRNLQTCAATMLWGCSSGALREMGDFDRMGTPYNYMLAGCPTLVANLWDVTDKDIDKFSQSVFDKLQLTAGGIEQWTTRSRDTAVSIVNAVAQSRDSCKLKYLTGAAPVVYGIPFYL